MPRVTKLLPQDQVTFPHEVRNVEVHGGWGTVEWLTMLFFFMLSNSASDMICLFSSTVGDRPRKWQILSTSRLVSCETERRETSAQRKTSLVVTIRPTTLHQPRSCLRRTCNGALNTSVFSATSRSRDRTRIQTPLDKHGNCTCLLLYVCCRMNMPPTYSFPP